MRMEQLVGDVRQNGGAARREAALGDEDEQPREELLDVGGRLELRELREEFGGEILGVRMGGGQAGMTETKTGASVQNGKTTPAAIDGVVAAAGGIAGAEMVCLVLHFMILDSMR